MLKRLALTKVFTLIEPGPVLLVSTCAGDVPNLMTITWSTVMSFSSFAIVTGPWNHSYAALRETGECVVAVPGADLREKVVGIGMCSGADTDKFRRFHLTPLPAKTVRAPLVAECLANVECQVDAFLPEFGLFVLSPRRAWTNPERRERRTFHANGDGTFVLDGRTVSLRQEMAAKIPPGV